MLANCVLDIGLQSVQESAIHEKKKKKKKREQSKKKKKKRKGGKYISRVSCSSGCCQVFRGAMPAARPPALFRETDKVSASGLPAPAPAPAAVRRALFDSKRARSEAAAVVDSDEAKAPRRAVGRGAGRRGA